VTRSIGKIVCWCLFALAIPLRAETVENLYAGVVEAQGRSNSALNTASREALAQVLVKVSGSPQVLADPTIQASLGQARNLVLQYAYLEAGDGSGVPVRFEFDGESVTKIITDAGVPLWTANRPVVLVWLVSETELGPQFVSPDSDPQMTSELLAAFGRRGVPLQLPLFDLADTAALRPDEVWRISEPAVEVASRRYGHEDVLIGRVSVVNDETWIGGWSYLDGRRRLDANVAGAALPQFMDAGVNLVADTMAARYAVAPTLGLEGGISMSVAGVNSYGDYAAVIALLESVELVESVRVVGVQGDRLRLRLAAQVDPGQLAGIFRLNENLQETPGADQRDQLSYQWQN
jgi:uncharacterized protein